MTTDNALDPPPVRGRTGRPAFPRIAAIVAGVIIVALVIFAIVHVAVLGPEAAQRAAMRTAFERQSSSSPPPQVAPAVTAQQAAQTQANLMALQRAADAPDLNAQSVQVATVSPPAGRAPSGTGVTRSSDSVGPADG